MNEPRTDDPISAQYRAIATGDADAARRAVALDWQNREAADEAPAARLGGPVGLAVTAAWLRSAFSEIAFEEIERLVHGNVVLSRVMFSGRQTGPLVLFEDGKEPAVFPPTGRTFKVEQMHRHELRDGEVVHHLARRDDLGMMGQLGHIPPTPRSVLRMIAWRLTGKNRRAVADAIATGERAAAVMSERLAREASLRARPESLIDEGPWPVTPRRRPRPLRAGSRARSSSRAGGGRSGRRSQGPSAPVSPPG